MQDFFTERWKARDGLPDSTITSVTQAQDGALWVGTSFGLARFDGVQFQALPRKSLPGLLSSEIENLATGPDSQVYLGTDRGLTVLRHRHARTFQEREGTQHTRVMMILPVGADDAWFGTFTGHLYHYHHDSVEEMGAGVLTREPVYGLAMAPDSTLWVATGAGLFFVSRNTIARYQPKEPLPITPIFDLAIATDGRLFAASDGGLFEIEGDHWRAWTKQSGLPSNALNVLTMDPQGVLWIGSDRGLARLANGIVQPVSAVNCPVNSVLVDREKSLWVGCGSAKGLMRVTTAPVRLIQVPGASHPAPISSLVEDAKGAVWIGSNRGLFRYQNNRFKSYPLGNGPASNTITSIAPSAADGLWVGTNDGLARLQKSRFQLFRTKAKGLLNPFVSVFEDRYGTLWVELENGLLRRRLAGRTDFEDVPEGSDLWSIHEDREGSLWMATSSHGLLRFTGKSKTSFTTACGLGSSTVYDSAQDDTGAIWAWTDGGLSRVRGDTCANIGLKDGVPQGRAGSMLFDRRGHLWLRTQDEIAAINVAEANNVLDHGEPLRSTRYFGRDDGFGDSLFDTPVYGQAMLMHSSGAIWIPTVGGIAVINPAMLDTPAPRLRPQVISVTTDTGEHDVAMPVTVQPGDLHMQFAYSAGYLLGAKKREYRYRLAGFDKEWRDGEKRREAVYTSLPAGKYRFEMSARLPFEPWSEASAPIEVIVLPHFYQTWWWYTLVVLVSASVIALAYRLQMIAVRWQYAVLAAERTRERSRLARELHDTLSQGLMAIHVQIQLARSLLRSRPDAASAHLETAVGIARHSASQTRRCIGTLRSDSDEIMTLREMLDEAISRFTESSRIPLAATIEDDLPLLSEEVSHEIARVAEEALANVRLHSDAEQAYLFARISGKWLHIEVLDNGKGFQRSDPEHASPDHFGLTGMEERAQRLHGRLEARTAPGKGTTILLEVPLDTRGKRRNSILRRVTGMRPT